MAGYHLVDTNWVAGLQLIDISDPANPRRVGGLDGISGSNLAISGKYAFLAGRHQDVANYVSSGLDVVDISNSANPQLVGGYDLAGTRNDLAVLGNYA